MGPSIVRVALIFIALVFATSLRADAQTSRVPKVAVLFAGVPGRSPQLEGLYDRLRELGYVEGKSITIELRSADGEFERLPQLAAELLARGPDVIVASTTPSVAAIQRLTSSIPIVMVAVGDPLGFHFVANLRDEYRRAADYVDKILRGAKPAELPVEQPTRFELCVNLGTAKALGLTLAPALLLRADWVIK